MAAEIRDLEDQLYEYDHEYRLLEQELATLRQRNSALKQTAPQSSPQRSLLAPSPLPHSSRNQQRDSAAGDAPRDARPVPPDPMLAPPAAASPSDSILEPVPGTARPPSSEEIPPPQAGRIPVPPSGSGSPGGSAPPAQPRSPEVTPPSQPRQTPSDSFDGEELLAPPTIEPGIPAPPPLPSVTLREDGQAVAPEDQLELNLSRVEIPSGSVPAQLASATAAKPGSLHITSDQITDRRIVELAFHPTLTRAIDVDDHPDDDAVYLVLQPKNERGQVVPEVAELTIIVLDPAREGDAAKMGRWQYSASEVQSKFQPIGSEQGIHLQLPWNGPDPTADRVIVFALFKFTDGRQVMGEKEILVSGESSHKTVWTARGASGVQAPAVAAASYTAPPAANTSTAQPPAASENRELPKPVIRPASGSWVFDPAPEPR